MLKNFGRYTLYKYAALDSLYCLPPLFFAWQDKRYWVIYAQPRTLDDGRFDELFRHRQRYMIGQKEKESHLTSSF